MKKLISILCAGAMLLSLAACGSTSGGLRQHKRRRIRRRYQYYR